MVCALYLSVGTVFSAMHDHSADALHGDQECAACAWHHESVDLPTVTAVCAAPDLLLAAHDVPSLFFSKVALGIHPSRGPPSHPHKS